MEVGKNEGLGCCGRRATLYITGGSQCPSTSNLNDALHIGAHLALLGKARRAKSTDLDALWLTVCLGWSNDATYWLPFLSMVLGLMKKTWSWTPSVDEPDNKCEPHAAALWTGINYSKC